MSHIVLGGYICPRCRIQNAFCRAYPLDIINFVNAIRQQKQHGIFIVLIHLGSEYYPYSSPEHFRKDIAEYKGLGKLYLFCRFFTL